jgi:hypothetical protein
MHEDVQLTKHARLNLQYREITAEQAAGDVDTV